MMRRLERGWVVVICPAACLAAACLYNVGAAEITAILSYVAGLHILHNRKPKEKNDVADPA